MLVEPCFVNGDCGLGLDDRAIWIWEQATYHLTIMGIVVFITGGLTWLKLTLDDKKRKERSATDLLKDESETK